MKKTGEKDELEKVDADDKEQSQRFVETAEQLESDKSARPFDRAMKIVAEKKEVKD